MSFACDIYICFWRSGAPKATEDAFTRWSRKILNTLYEEVNPQNFDLPPVRFHPDYPYVAADTVTLPADAQRIGADRAALLLVLLSPELVADPARIAEIEAFRQQAASDGRTAMHTILATIAPTPLETVRGDALDWLLQQGTRPLNGEGFSDTAGLPVERALDEFDPFVQLVRPIQSLAGEIRKKIKELNRAMPERPLPAVEPAMAVRIDIEAEIADNAAPPAERLLLYLQSATDPQLWMQTRDALNAVATVNPAEMPRTGFGADMRQRDDARRGFLASSSLLVLVRAQAHDPVDLHVAMALNDFRMLRQSGYEDPAWILVDWVEDAGPSLQPGVQLPRISARDHGWPSQVVARRS